MEDIDELFERTFGGDSAGPFTTVNGCLINEKFRKYADEIENFEVKDTDIWVASFPKTGTTWLQELTYLIATDSDYDAAKTSISVRFPFLELETLTDTDDIPPAKPDDLLQLSRFYSVQYSKDYKSIPRFIKTHLPWQLLPKAIRNKEKQPKILYVTRDPKDTCVSYYYHNLRWGTFKGTFEEFCRLFLADKMIYSPFFDHVSNYWQRRNDENILFLRYEDMKNKMQSTIEKVAKFLNKTVTDDQMEKLLIHLNFDTMKHNESVNYEDMTKLNIKFMRKGIVGDHKNLMSPEIMTEFDDWIAENDPGVFKFD